MSAMFKTDLVTLEKNVIKNLPGTRQPTAGFDPFGKNVPCHIGRTSKSGDVLKLHILKIYLDLLPGPVMRGFKITDERTGNQYSIIDYPVWGGGQEHHLECTLAPYQ